MCVISGRIGFFFVFVPPTMEKNRESFKKWLRWFRPLNRAPFAKASAGQASGKYSEVHSSLFGDLPT